MNFFPPYHYNFAPSNLCHNCGQPNCINEMCLPDASHLMIGDEGVPQLGTEEAGLFFQPLNYEGIDK